MTRAFDFTVSTVVTIIAVVVHRMGVELLAPGTPLHDVATDGTGNVNGPEFAEFVWQAVSIWIPLIAIIGILAWAMLREYRRQAVTGTTRPV